MNTNITRFIRVAANWLVAPSLLLLSCGTSQAQDVTGFGYGTYTNVNSGTLNYGTISNPFTVTYSGGAWLATSTASFTPVAIPASLSNYVKPANMLELGALVTSNPSVPPFPVVTYTFDSPLPATTVMFIQDVDALESFKIEFLNASGTALDPTTLGTYHLSNPARSSVAVDPTALTVTANDNVNHPESLSDFIINSSLVKQVRITQIASRTSGPNSGTAEFYFAAPSPPTADDETSLNNTSGSNVSLDLLAGDVLGNGTQVTPALVTVNFTAPAGGAVVGNSISVPGEGEWIYDPSTGIITFSPETGFMGNPTPITYTLTENATGLSDQATVTVTYGTLPVTLVAFDASYVESRVHLTWKTTEESNSDYFQIERSTDAKNWLAIGNERAMELSQALVQYEYWDDTPTAGKSYYRLKMVDRDQTFAYSKIRDVNGQIGSTRPVVYPNPAIDHVNVSDLNVSHVKEWSLTSTAGNTVTKGTRLATPVIDLKDLRSGVYILSITFGDGVSRTQKILINK